MLLPPVSKGLAIRSLGVLFGCFYAVAVPADSGRQNPVGEPKLSAHGNVEMVYVSEGTFTMGAIYIDLGQTKFGKDEDVTEEGAFVTRRIGRSTTTYHNDEGPKHSVYLDGYWIGKNLVTVHEFREFTKATHFKFDWKTNQPEWGWLDSHPMVMVTWDQARAFCKWAGGDLPTEAQWEKAARGTDEREYPWGNDWDPSRLWSGHPFATAPIGSCPSGASPYGCLDMAGNAWEWCLDWYGMDYVGLPQTNPKGVEKGDTRVIRGGSFYLLGPMNYRCAYRYAADPKAGACVYGFRLALPK